MNIFAEYAPKYWAAGIPVMPLKKLSKAPILNEWTTYAENMPTQAVQNHWLGAYPTNNIGLPFGPASGLAAIDIDTEDQDIVDQIMDCLPASPWVRVGKKGCGLIFKWQGQKNFKVRAESGMLCEMLGHGNQMVMPHSIHPDCRACGEKNAAQMTGFSSCCNAPNIVYGSNTDLWEVMDSIQPLGLDIENQLRDALGVKGFSLVHAGRSGPMVVVPAGERDIQMVSHAGYLARVVLGIDKSARFTLADAMKHMHHWVTEFTAGAAGDDMDPDKGVAKLLEFLLRDIENGRTMPKNWDEGLTAEQLEHPTIAAMGDKNAAARWTFTKAKQWLAEQILLKPDDEDWIVETVFTLVSKVAEDDQYKDFDFAVLLPEIARQLSPIKVSKADLKKAFAAAREVDSEAGEDHEVLAKQIIEAIERSGELRHNQGFFWQWNGSCFGQLPHAEIHKMVGSLLKGNILLRRHNDYVALVKEIAIQVSKPLADTLEVGVNFANGFLDAHGELHAHSPKFGRTFTMPFNYVPSRASECHKWLEFLERSWGDDADYADKVAALQEAMAVTMFGVGPMLQRVVLLYGKGGTGKSQVLEVLRAIMPPAAVCAVPPNRWGEKFGAVNLVGRALNICGELPETGMIDGASFKGIVGGEKMELERKGMDPFPFTPIATHWFASNFLPRSFDSSAAFTRRWLILEFNRVVPLSERVLNFHEELVAEEREAIAAWAVQGLARALEKKDYTIPASHVYRLNQVKRANNSVAAWLQSNQKVMQGEGWADARECFDQYHWYMKDVIGRSGGRAAGYEQFLQMIDELGHVCEDYVDVLKNNRTKIKGLVVTGPSIGVKEAA